MAGSRWSLNESPINMLKAPSTGRR
ncbi:hypothetical protein NC653_031303 [Populus alba x Populus x berolinensis]|uniref:Uncharacterized protein n=1 Tax=Populus alba x Populus x berolinensis TaxID=444605 RepID=A0AAD6Q369_9ROSI|nr:hypothetical protein NC653_031303 [Populus alba x Populus x berolinensis]